MLSFHAEACTTPTSQVNKQFELVANRLNILNACVFVIYDRFAELISKTFLLSSHNSIYLFISLLGYLIIFLLGSFCVLMTCFSLAGLWGHKGTCDYLQSVKIITGQLMSTKREPLVKCNLSVPALVCDGGSEEGNAEDKQMWNLNCAMQTPRIDT